MGLIHVLAFIIGILAVQTLRELPAAPVLGLLVLPALLPWRLRRLFATFVLGIMLACWQAQVLLDQRWPIERHDQEHWVQGRVASLPDHSVSAQRYDKKGQPRDENPSQIWRFLFEPDSDHNAAGLPTRIRVSWYRKAALTPLPARQAVTPSPAGGRGTMESLRDFKLEGGDCWRLKLKLKTPHGSLNPGAFDYEAWLFRQGIGATATVRDAQRCEQQQGYWVLRLRQSLVQHLQQWLPQHPALGLVAALTVGDTSALSSADWDDFRLTGTTHLIAISGFNIAIISGVAFFIFRWLWALWPPLCLRLPAQKAGMLGGALSALGYALLAGFEPPVTRAVIMLWVLLAAAWLHRLAQSARVLALAAAVILLFDPLAVMAPGLWLSFGAVAAIFYISTQRLGRSHWLWTLLSVQLMLSLALMPMTLYFFNGASWAAPLVNLLAVPLLTVLTPVLLFAVALAFLWPEAGVSLLVGCADLLQHLRDALAALAATAPQMWLAAHPPVCALVIALFGAVLLFAPRGLPLRPLALLCFIPLLFPPQTAPRAGFELTVLDVGQGLSAVVRTARHTLVFDAGPAFEEGLDAGESIVAPYLLSAGVHSVDLLLISHADNDHSGGAPALRRLLRVQGELGALTAQACHEGQTWDWDGVRFEMLHPDAAAWSGNNSSCVLRVSVGTQAVLLTGDIEKAAERRLLRERGQALPAQLLIAPHHGSKTSSTQAFIEAVNPHTVIFSAGWKHHFHHPHPSVVERYALSGAQLYDTGWAGALTLQVNTEKISEVRAWRQQANRYWNAAAAEMPVEE